MVGGAFVDGVVEGAAGGAVAGVPEVGAARPGVVWAT